ncbi:hypothetical protein DXV75_16960 [Alteromonas aestuariivivens]|uniref:Uncharacterized protein n=1 Tax=Alteromonas aestuariivivens TaxID=1938339 RepID=A0A3D8M2U0_9ALTE|nr:hypothetical protein [Alteromonas aestuariivivens]RDV23875.1 hypothetical protein DXV75_16960 [Alteromonas aestuariivivens]
MDALDKLAEKNRTHQKHVKAEKLAVALIALGLLPFYVDLVYSIITSDASFPQRLVFAFVSCIGSLCFSCPILAMVDLSLFSYRVKAIILVFTQSWFIYFWVFSEAPWVGFLPSIPVYLAMRRQLPEIKAKAANGDYDL